ARSLSVSCRALSWFFFFFFSSRRRHTRSLRDWSSDVCSSDLGQGDASALRSPAGRWVLIDGGPRGPQGDAGRRVVVPFLRSHGATQLAAVVATHAHRDHFGGLPAVLDAFDPAYVLEPGQPVPDAGY